MATGRPRLEVFKVLIEKGIDINESVDDDDDGAQTALMVAAYKRHVAVVDYLLMHPSLCCIDRRCSNSQYAALHYSGSERHNAQVTKLSLHDRQTCYGGCNYD